MYIIINESWEVVCTKAIRMDDIESADCGCITIIDTSKMPFVERACGKWIAITEETKSRMKLGGRGKAKW